ncbi:unnamed protein product [Linum trigynum]
MRNGTGKEQSKDAKPGHQPKMKETQNKHSKSTEMKNTKPPENVVHPSRKINFDPKQGSDAQMPENATQSLTAKPKCGEGMGETAMAVDSN